jgi:hypothetical protein
MGGENIIPAGPPIERTYRVDEVFALREFADTAMMYCERLPLEVREELHMIPGVDRNHRCSLSKEQR